MTAHKRHRVPKLLENGSVCGVDIVFAGDEQLPGDYEGSKPRHIRQQYDRTCVTWMADYCLSLKRDNPASAYTQESKKRLFMP
ncbi:hypothetical protein QYM36_005144 [Artemia franciscana]|uniref:Uncharacterized protein n=1 Tax=Artemia franciscana TaxID=6661 RepID=A0AA88HYP7_ARTSF|nr:hypothetical protein QYM36_005144 [Artemia franciscana]